MSTALEQAMQDAFQNAGSAQQANKAYLEFIKANFIIPIQKHSQADAPEVLFLQENGQTFLPVFTTDNYLRDWAKDIGDDIQILRLSGVDLLRGIGDEVTICLNIGTTLYKAFNPDEIARMRSIILKFFK